VPSASFELTIVALLILVNGAFSMAEMAIVSARKARLEHRARAGDQQARLALELASDPSLVLSTVQIGITLVGVLAGAFGGATLSNILARELEAIPALAANADAIALGIVVISIAYLTLIFGELVPKRLALQSPERVAEIVAGPIKTVSRIASPAVALLDGSTDLVLRLLGVRPSEEAPVTEEEIAVLVEQGRQAGVFQLAEQEIIESVFRLADRRVDSVMTPRHEIVWLDADDGPEEIRQVVLNAAHAIFPVCRGDLDRVIGIVMAKDILAATLSGEPLDLPTIARPPLIVPGRLWALKLLEQFRAQGTHLALVVDELGTLDGLVTTTDLLEALVGDLPTPQELAEPDIVRRDDGSWLIDGLLAAEALKDLLGIAALPDEADGDYRTVAGLVIKVLGRIPRTGDSFALDGRHFEVVDMDGNRIDKILVSPIPSGANDGDASAPAT
jgi:putative hemolysin